MINVFLTEKNSTCSTFPTQGSPKNPQVRTVHDSGPRKSAVENQPVWQKNNYADWCCRTTRRYIVGRGTVTSKRLTFAHEYKKWLWTPSITPGAFSLVVSHIYTVEGRFGLRSVDTIVYIRNEKCFIRGFYRIPSSVCTIFLFKYMHLQMISGKYSCLYLDMKIRSRY